MMVAAAIVGGAVVSGAASSSAASKASKASQKSTDATTAESQRQFDLVRADTANQRQIGTESVDKLRSLFINGDYSAVRNDPGYQFNLSEGQKAIDNSLIARGKGLSGQAVKAGISYATGLADNTATSIFQRYAQLAGLGTQGVNTSAAAGSNTASTVANANANNAAQQSSSYYTGASGINSAIQGSMSNYLINQYLKPGNNNTGTPTLENNSTYGWNPNTWGR